MKTKQTPLHGFHRAHNARMVPFAGWDMPMQYAAGIKAEHLATRQSAGLFDVSHMAQLEISGSQAAADLSALTPSDIEGIGDGPALLSATDRQINTGHLLGVSTMLLVTAT